MENSITHCDRNFGCNNLYFVKFLYVPTIYGGKFNKLKFDETWLINHSITDHKLKFFFNLILLTIKEEK